MDWGLLLANLLNPPVLFFFLGVFAVLAKSDLEIPQPIPKLLSLYLLFAIGLKGGIALRLAGITSEVLATLGAALVLAAVVPFYVFFLARVMFDRKNAAAIAATYGSVSAVTFITATSFLQRVGEPFGGHLVAAMALMESPAIIIGVLLARGGSNTGEERVPIGELLRDGFLNGSVVLLLGSLAIGWVISPADALTLEAPVKGLFVGVLCFFLLDMGLVAAHRMGDVRKTGSRLLLLGALLPIINAAVGVCAARLLDLGRGDALILTVLAASASYIAVPAALRLALPDASPAIYVTLSLGVTFPLNVTLGIPLYYWVLQLLIP